MLTDSQCNLQRPNPKVPIAQNIRPDYSNQPRAFKADVNNIVHLIVAHIKVAQA